MYNKILFSSFAVDRFSLVQYIYDNVCCTTFKLVTQTLLLAALWMNGILYQRLRLCAVLSVFVMIMICRNFMSI